MFIPLTIILFITLYADPHMRPEAPKVTLHDVMEVKLNLV